MHHRRSVSQTVPKVQFNITAINPATAEVTPSNHQTAQPPSPRTSPSSSPIGSPLHGSMSPSSSPVIGHSASSESSGETILHRYCPWCGTEFKWGDVFCSFCGNRRNSYKTQSTSAKPKWKKILYEKQPYEDNYVDETFLNALVKNANFTGYQLKDVISGSTVVTQQISTVALFIILFYYTLNGVITVPVLISLDVILVAAGFILRVITDVSFNANSFFKSVKTLILLFGSLFSLSPVLRTLTNSFSDDTISACTVLLLLAHLFFHDYGYINGEPREFTAPVSLNAAIFASVLLASRLPSNLHVFALISIAIEVFALFPIMRHHLKIYSIDYHNWLTTLMTLLTFSLFYTISKTVAAMYTAAILFISFVCPLWLVFIQKYKNEINGPWDEAKIQY